jgi:hypothetical protein
VKPAEYRFFTKNPMIPQRKAPARIERHAFFFVNVRSLEKFSSAI